MLGAMVRGLVGLPFLSQVFYRIQNLPVYRLHPQITDSITDHGHFKVTL
jgi:hypothetical protein